jgi:hypothetical protein
MKALAWCVLPLMFACTEVHRIEHEMIGAERYFFVSVDGSGAVLEVSSIHETDSTTEVIFPVEGDTEEVFIVGLAGAQLLKLDERFDAARAPQIRLQTPPAAGSLFLAGDDASLRTKLPEDAKILQAASGAEASSGERAAIAAAVTVELPIRLGLCADDHPMRLVPYGASPELLAELTDPKDSTLLRVAPGNHGALLLTETTLYAVKRGEAIDLQSPGSVIPASALGTEVRFTSLARDNLSYGVENQNQYLLGGVLDGAPAVWRLAFDAAGVRVMFLYPVATPPMPGAIQDVMFDGQNIAVAVGDHGTVFTAENADDPFGLVDTPSGAEGSIRRAAASHILTQPHAISGDEKKLYLGYAWAGYWDVLEMRERLNSIVASTDGDELWVAGEGGYFGRILDSIWSEPELPYPPELAPCGVREDTTGHILIDDPMIGAAIDGAFVYLQPQSCSALLRVRRRDLCVSAIEDAPPIRLGGERTTVGYGGDEVLIGGARGLLLTVDR